MFLDCIIR